MNTKKIKNRVIEHLFVKFYNVTMRICKRMINYLHSAHTLNISSIHAIFLTVFGNLLDKGNQYWKNNDNQVHQ